MDELIISGIFFPFSIFGSELPQITEIMESKILEKEGPCKHKIEYHVYLPLWRGRLYGEGRAQGFQRYFAIS